MDELSKAIEAYTPSPIVGSFEPPRDIIDEYLAWAAYMEHFPINSETFRAMREVFEAAGMDKDRDDWWVL